MFEDEIKMEERSSNIMPLLMAAMLILGALGIAGYLILESTRSVGQQEALTATKTEIAARGPEKVHFHVGFVKPGMDEPFDPHYRLLEKAGLVKLGKPTYRGLDVKLTPAGAALLQASGAQEEKDKHGNIAYTVPLAERKLLEVTKVEMVSSRKAVVEYAWNWQPTPLGLVFDISSQPMGKLPINDRAVLIQKYGATYYLDQKPKTRALRLQWDEKNRKWRLAS